MQDGFNALMWAAYVGNAGTLTALLDNGANLKTRNNVRNWTGELSDRINLSKFLSPMLLQPLCSSPSHLWYLHFLWICSFSLSHSIPLFPLIQTHSTFSLIQIILFATFIKCLFLFPIIPDFKFSFFCHSVPPPCFFFFFLVFSFFSSFLSLSFLLLSFP